MQWNKGVLLLCFLFVVCQSSFHYEWNKVGLPNRNEIIEFSVALKQQNTKQLERIALEVSDPDSPSYGKHLKLDQILSIVAPPKEHHDYVQSWLLSVDGVSLTSHGDGFRVEATVEAAEQLFQCTFFTWEHDITGHKAIRQEGGMKIPEDIKQYVHMFTSLTAFPIIQKTKEKPTSPDTQLLGVQAAPFGYVSANTIKRLYNIPVDLVAKSPKTVQVAMEFLPVGAPLPADLTKYGQLSEVANTPWSRVVGPMDTGMSDGESTLDVELLNGVGTGAANWYWTIKTGWVYEMATELLTNNSGNPNIVVSVSYGWPEIFTCQSSITGADCTGIDAQTYVQRCEVELAKLAAVGMTVVICTQDEGAPSEANIYCGNKTHPVYGIYPGSSAWVTAVSGTTVSPVAKSVMAPPDTAPICSSGYACTGDSFEVPCQTNNTYYEWTTGGGFSDYIVRPGYQDAAVESYLAKSNVLKPPTNLFGYQNRGYADISAAGSRILIVQSGQVSVSAGTSASTPIIAGVASLLNDLRFQQGKAALGFLNPLLYKMGAEFPSAYNDVISGDNRCTRYTTCCSYGFGATQGWDAVTGWGTPNFGAMASYINKLP